MGWSNIRRDRRLAGVERISCGYQIFFIHMGRYDGWVMMKEGRKNAASFWQNRIDYPVDRKYTILIRMLVGVCKKIKAVCIMQNRKARFY
jgi:hypothetical protein